MKNRRNIFLAPLTTFVICTVLFFLVQQPLIKVGSTYQSILLSSIFAAIFPAIAILIVSSLAVLIRKKRSLKSQDETVLEDKKSPFDPFRLMYLFFLSIFIMAAIAALVGWMSV